VIPRAHDGVTRAARWTTGLAHGFPVAVVIDTTLRLLDDRNECYVPGGGQVETEELR
jgi:hypothetical protein